MGGVPFCQHSDYPGIGLQWIPKLAVPLWGSAVLWGASPPTRASTSNPNLLSVREPGSAPDDLCEEGSDRRSKRFHLPNGRGTDPGRQRTRSAPPEPLILTGSRSSNGGAQALADRAQDRHEQNQGRAVIFS